MLSECLHKRILNDVIAGEIICLDCGVVLGKAEFAPPPIVRLNRKLKGFELTSYRLGTSLAASVKKKWSCFDRQAKTELKVVLDVEKICDWLDAPSKVESQAAYVARKILKAMRNGSRRVRFSFEEIAAVSVFLAYRFMTIPLSARRYAEVLSRNLYGGKTYDKRKILRLYRRAVEIVGSPSYWGDPVDYLRVISSRLERRVESRYLSLIERYAVSILRRAVRSGKYLLCGRSPILAAAASLLVADKRLGDILGVKSIMEVAGVSWNVKGLASWLEGFAPPVPPEALPYKFKCY